MAKEIFRASFGLKSEVYSFLRSNGGKCLEENGKLEEILCFFWGLGAYYLSKGFIV